MKRVLALILCMAMALSFVACAQPAAEKPAQETPGTTETPAEPSAGAYTAGTYTGIAQGMNGDVEVIVTFTDSAIESITMGKHNETPGISDSAINTLPNEIVAAQSLNVDTVTGATFTSNAILQGVADAVVQAGGDVDALKAAPPVADGADKLEAAELNTDVVVVGAGMAGSLASLSLAKQGYNVILLEKMPYIGGSSALCGAGMEIAGSRPQREAGIQDDLKAFEQALLERGNHKNDMDVLPIHVNNAGIAVDWLVDNCNIDMGKPLRPDEPEVGLYELVGNGEGVMAQMKGHLDSEEKVNLMLSTKGTELIVTDGVVTGIQAEGDKAYTINAKAVVLSTGGFSCNEEMLKGIKAPGTINYGPKSLTGDGHQMAMAIGGYIINPEYLALRCQGIETEPGFGRAFPGYTKAVKETGAFVVNNKGVRVMKEEQPDGMKIPVYLEQEDQALYIVMDQAGYDIFRESGSTWLLFQYPPEQADAWLAADSKYPLLVKGDTVAEAAEAAGIDGAVLTATAEAFNKMVADGKDTEFDHAISVPLNTEGPVYILQMFTRFCQTLGGLKANDKLQIVKESGEAIPGLYGAGEMVGGVFGEKEMTIFAWSVSSGYYVSQVVGEALK